MIISPQKKIYLSLFVFLLIIGALFYLAFLPCLRNLSLHSQELTSQEALLGLLMEQLDTFADFQNEKLAYQEYFDIISQSFVREEAPIRFMKFLEEQASLLGLELVVSSLPLPQDPQYTLIFELNLTGSFQDNLRFLDRLEKSGWAVEITSLTARRLEEKEIKLAKERPLSPGETTFSVRLKAASANAVKVESSS